MTSSERRVTVSGTIYPKLEQLAARDQVTVADVVNAILLQTLRPYGNALVVPPVTSLPSTSTGPDPYQAAVPDAW